MSKKLQENGIWESSRMMLPQHREVIIANQNVHKKMKKPILHEDEWEIINQNINYSLTQEEEITVTIFGEYKHTKFVGVVTSVSPHQKKFKLVNEQGFEWIDFAEILSVQI